MLCAVSMQSEGIQIAALLPSSRHSFITCIQSDKGTSAVNLMHVI